MFTKPVPIPTVPTAFRSYGHMSLKTMAPKKQEPLATDHHGCRERSHSVTHMPQVWTRRHQKYSWPCQREKGISWLEPMYLTHSQMPWHLKHPYISASTPNSTLGGSPKAAHLYLMAMESMYSRPFQGHPESPRLWAILINGIISNIGFKTCKHETCTTLTTKGKRYTLLGK